MSDFILLPSGRIINRLAVTDCRPPFADPNDPKGRPLVDFWINGKVHTAGGDDALHLYAAMAYHARPVSDAELAVIGLEASNDD